MTKECSSSVLSSSYLILADQTVPGGQHLSCSSSGQRVTIPVFKQKGKKTFSTAVLSNEGIDKVTLRNFLYQ